MASERGDPLQALLVSEQVGLAAGENWLLTCHHAAAPSKELGDTPSSPVSLDALESTVSDNRSPRALSSPTPANLGLLVLRAIADTSNEARRVLRGALDRWESDVYDKLGGHPSDETSSTPQRTERVSKSDLLPIIELRRVRDRLFTQLEPLNQPGMKNNPELIWFRGGDAQLAEEVDVPLDRALKGLRDFGDVLRDAVSLFATLLAAEQQRQSESLQTLATFIAAVLLVPTLVGTIYGANTYLPGKDRVTGLLIMFSAMVLTAVITGFGIQLWRERRDRTQRLPSDGRTPSPLSARPGPPPKR
jgi:Mg2+ and Co2+ transporter CorA